jgi:type IV pili sensor histidine kinase/response regulator
MATNRVLDRDSLSAIAQEARNCFIYEEAPEYLRVLQSGIAQFQTQVTRADLADPIYPELIRAAHSLKGGAAIAGLTALSRLAHKLEDLLIALHERRTVPGNAALELMGLGCDLLDDLLLDALRGSETEQGETPGETLRERRIGNLLASLDRFLRDLPPSLPPSPDAEDATSSGAKPLTAFAKTALTVDLEDCLQRLQGHLVRAGSTFGKPLQTSQENPPVSKDGAALDKPLNLFLEECTLLGQTLGLTALTDLAAEIEQLRGKKEPIALAKAAIARVRAWRDQILAPGIPAAPQKGENRPTPPSDSKDLAGIPEPFLKYLVFNPGRDRPVASLNLRVPVARLDRMSHTVGELLMTYERLALYQQQLDLTGENLQRRTEDLGAIPPGPVRELTKELQELTVQLHESRADVEAIARELDRTLADLRGSLDRLHHDLTESRLMPFAAIAERFITPLEQLKKQYRKAIKLVVEGGDTAVDRVILEQLQAPLNHLFRNAFDHGIELPEERQRLGKAPVATITLSAKVEGSQMAIAVADDGRGIDPQKVYDRALAMGLIPRDRVTGTLAELSQGEILQFLFSPGFSTAAQVTDLSGRGVGLDIVRHQIEHIGGTLQVETAIGRGTKFTLSVPLTLSVIPVCLCRCGSQIVAFPADKVVGTIARWEDARDTPTAKAVPLTQLLPYRGRCAVAAPKPPAVGLWLQVEGDTVAIGVDELLGTRKVAIEPLDPLVPVPPYVAGCTVLGTGQVVAILSPSHLKTAILRSPLETPNERHPFADAPGSDDRESARKADASPPVSAARTPTILVADDSIAVRRALETLFTRVGYRAVACADGQDALEQLQRSRDPFDLVLSDIEMPRLNGLQLLKAIRDDRRWDALPVVMLTSRDGREHFHKAMELGANAYLTKPFQPQPLLEAIENVLAEIKKS